jgi:hypothetical protein
MDYYGHFAGSGTAETASFFLAWMQGCFLMNEQEMELDNFLAF